MWRTVITVTVRCRIPIPTRTPWVRHHIIATCDLTKILTQARDQYDVHNSYLYRAAKAERPPGLGLVPPGNFGQSQ